MILDPIDVVGKNGAIFPVDNDGVMRKIVSIIEGTIEGDEIARLSSIVLGVDVSYDEDSVWYIDGREYDFDDLEESMLQVEMSFLKMFSFIEDNSEDILMRDENGMFASFPQDEEQLLEFMINNVKLIENKFTKRRSSATDLDSEIESKSHSLLQLLEKKKSEI